VIDIAKIRETGLVPISQRGDNDHYGVAFGGDSRNNLEIMHFSGRQDL